MGNNEMSSISHQLRTLTSERRRYILANAPSHLLSADRFQQLLTLLTTFDFLQEKLNFLGTSQLIADFVASQAHELQAIKRALEISAPFIDHSQQALASQLYGRLMNVHEQTVQLLLANILGSPQPWLRPITSSLTQTETLLLRSLSNHPESILSSSISKSGHLLVTGGYYGNIKVWDLHNYSLLKTYPLSNAPIRAVACADPGGEIIIAGDEDGILYLINQNTDSYEQFAIHQDSIERLQVLTRAKLLLTASADHSIKLLDLDQLSLMENLLAEDFAGRAIASNTMGTMIFWGDNKGYINIWSAEANHVRRWNGHNGPVEDICLLEDSKRLVTISNAYTMKLWDYEQKKELGVLEGHPTTIESETKMTSSPDGSTVFYIGGSRRSHIKAVRVESMKEVYQIEAHSWPITNVTVTSSSDRIISVGQDARVKIWQYSAEIRDTKRRLKHSDDVVSVAISHDGYLGATCSLDSTIKLWNPINGAELGEFDEKGVFPYKLCIAPDNRYLVVGGFPNRISVWNIEHTPPFRSQMNEEFQAKGFVVSEDFSQVLTITMDSLVLWSLEDGQELKRFAISDGLIQDVIGDSSLERVFLLCNDFNIRVIDLRTNQTPLILTGHTDRVMALALLPGGYQAVSASRDNTLILWDLQSGQVICNFVGHRDGVNDVVIVPGEQLKILSASNDRTLALWNPNSHEPINIFEGHTDLVRRCYVSKNGKLAASISIDETVILWHIEKATRVTTFGCENRPIECALSPDSSRLIVGEMGGAVHILKLENMGFC